jgi:hypothetical protein
MKFAFMYIVIINMKADHNEAFTEILGFAQKAYFPSVQITTVLVFVKCYI